LKSAANLFLLELMTYAYCLFKCSLLLNGTNFKVLSSIQYYISIFKYFHCSRGPEVLKSPPAAQATAPRWFLSQLDYRRGIRWLLNNATENLFLGTATRLEGYTKKRFRQEKRDELHPTGTAQPVYSVLSERSQSGSLYEVNVLSSQAEQT
jgi:hypothetical protein